MDDFDEIANILDNLNKSIADDVIHSPKPQAKHVEPIEEPMPITRTQSKDIPQISLDDDEVPPPPKPQENSRSSPVPNPEEERDRPIRASAPEPTQKRAPIDFRVPSFTTFFENKEKKKGNEAPVKIAPAKKQPPAIVQSPKTISTVMEAEKSQNEAKKQFPIESLEDIPPAPPSMPSPAPAPASPSSVPKEQAPSIPSSDSISPELESQLDDVMQELKMKQQKNERPPSPSEDIPPPMVVSRESSRNSVAPTSVPAHPLVRKPSVIGIDVLPPPPQGPAPFSEPEVLSPSNSGELLPKTRSESLPHNISTRLPPIEVKTPDTNLETAPTNSKKKYIPPSESESSESIQSASSASSFSLPVSLPASPKSTPLFSNPSKNSFNALEDIPPPPMDEIPPPQARTFEDIPSYSPRPSNRNTVQVNVKHMGSDGFSSIKSMTMRPPSGAHNEAVWKEYTSSSTGKKYYYNTITRETKWQVPPALAKDGPATVGPSTIKPRAQTQANIFEHDPQRSIRKIRHPTDKLPQVILTLSLVDDTKKKLIVTDDFSIQDLIYCFADKLDLWQTEYFAISAMNVDGTDRWLKPDRTLADERVTDQSKLVLKVKLFKQPKKLIDPAALRLMYLQVFQNVLKGLYPYSEKAAVHLGAHQLQILYGDFNPVKHRLGFFDETTIKAFLPLFVVNSRPVDYLERRLFSVYSKLKGMKPQEGISKYLELAKQSVFYGGTYFDVTESGAPRKFIVNEQGFYISKKESKDGFDFYPFEEISGWNQTSAGIQIRISNPEKKPLFDLVTATSQAISELLTEYYMLLSDQVELPPIPVPILPTYLPDSRLFLAPTPRQSADPSYSRLDVLKTSYLEECRVLKLEPSFNILGKIDEAIDNEEVLEELNLSQTKLSGEHLEALCKAIPKCQTYAPKKDLLFVENLSLKGLDVSNNLIGQEGAHAVQRILDEPSILLKSLNLKSVKLGPKGAQTLAGSLDKNRVLEELNLEDNDLGDRGAHYILEAIKFNKKINLLNLNKNHLGNEEKIWNLLGEHIRNNSNLASLSVGSNKLGDFGVNQILVALRRATKSLEHLDIHSGNFNPKSTKQLVIWLSQNSQMKSFNIANNVFSEKAGKELVKVLRDGVHRLSKLDIKACDLNNDAMKEICEAIGDNKRLEELNLGGNIIKKKAGEILSDGLNSNKSLRQLQLRNCSLTKGTLVLLLKMVRKHPAIKSLDIALNSKVTSTEVAKEIEDLLIYGDKLEELNLAACEITGSSQFFVHLITGLSKTTALKKLHLDLNKLGKYVSKLSEVITKNKDSKIESLTLRKTDVSKKEMHDFFKHLGSHAPLKYLALELNELERVNFEADLKAFPDLTVIFEPSKK